MLWALAVIFALLIETIFILHIVDPGYFGVSLELYKVLRVGAVCSAMLGAVALMLSFRKEKPKPAWLLALLMALSLVPTVHWVIQNDWFRKSSLIQRGNVRANELISYLKDYPDTKPQQAAKWLFNQKRSRLDRPRFIAQKLTYFVLGLPDSLVRYRDPMIASAYARLKVLPREKQLEGYAEIVRYVAGWMNPRNKRRLHLLGSAGAESMKLRLSELKAAVPGNWPAGTRKLVDDLLARPGVLLPVSARLDLKDDVTREEGVDHDKLSEELLDCHLLDGMASLGLSVEISAKNPLYRITVQRTNQTIKTTFTLGNKVLKEMKVPLYAMYVRLSRVSDGETIYESRAATDPRIFRLHFTKKRGRASLQREIFSRAMSSSCRQTVDDFSIRTIFPERRPSPGGLVKKPRGSGRP